MMLCVKYWDKGKVQMFTCHADSRNPRFETWFIVVEQIEVLLHEHEMATLTRWIAQYFIVSERVATSFDLLLLS